MTEFELVQEIDSGVWSAKGPQGHFLARRIAEYQDNKAKAAGLLDLDDSFTRVLNHENLVSVVGRIPHPQGDYLVWDLCDGGTLETLLGWVRCDSTAYHLPEALCWHVLRALIRAVTFLHDGKRLTDGEWKGDPAWTAILHRAIEPRNVFFQQPRGQETYGPCKLGGFGNAAVTGHIMGGPYTWPCSVAAAIQTGWEPLEKTRPKITRVLEESETRAYTLTDELWSVGKVIFAMMSGQRLAEATKCFEGGCLRAAADAQGCRCVLGGCQHIPSVQQHTCTHEVSDWLEHGKDSGWRRSRSSVHVVNLDTWLARARYSCWLRDAVKGLLDFDPKSKQLTAEAISYAEDVEGGYQAWLDVTACAELFTPDD
ncbi:protein kinase domain-containing protein [Purpureocillium lavendulum]|uniref:Protein kinase domain-containing protein n=1 Tax=Purpureocillium lavendulum TaxID=1247861 RepID=A0AB34FGV6_9HYPO|nr:protein kinase domain-containing protein [Purpureocillium lavendulum]